MVRMCRFLSIQYFVSVFFLLLLSGISSAADQSKDVDSAVKDRFLQEAPSKWEQYEARLQYLQGNRRSHHTISGSGTTAEISAFLDWKANETSKLLIQSSEQTLNGKATKRQIKAICTNSRYGFSLERRTKESPWLLTQVVQDRLADLGKRQFPSGYPESNALLIAFYRGVRLKDIVNKTEFQITSCRRMTVGGEESVEVAFNFDNRGMEEAFPFRGGKIVIDPKQLWCLRYYEARLSHPKFQGISIFRVLERGETEDSFPWPKHVVIETHSRQFMTTKENEDFKKIEDYTFDLQIPARLPTEDEFTLTAFGLPEPTWLAKKSTPWHLVVGCAGTACLGVFFFLRLLAKRANS